MTGMGGVLLAKIPKCYLKSLHHDYLCNHPDAPTSQPKLEVLKKLVLIICFRSCSTHVASTRVRLLYPPRLISMRRIWRCEPNGIVILKGNPYPYLARFALAIQNWQELELLLLLQYSGELTDPDAGSTLQ